MQNTEPDKDKDPQHYGIGFKEVWDVLSQPHSEGTVMHTFGWPSKSKAGSYFYHGEIIKST